MSNNSTAEVFSRAAPDFDRVGPRFFSQSGLRLVELANIPESSRILDVACGRGAVLFPVSEKVGADGQVFGVDLAEGMIRHTQSDIRNLNIRNIHLSQMDATQLAFDNAKFDFVLCSHSIGFFPQALSEIYRVLKPGGRVVLSIVASDCFKWLLDIFEQYRPSNEPDEESEMERLALDTPEGMESALRASGFAEIQIHNETMDMVYPDEETWWQMLWTLGFRSALETMSTKKLLEFKTDIAKALKNFKQQDGFHIHFESIYAMCIRL